MALLVCATAGVAAAKPSIAILGLEVIDRSGVPNNDDVTFAKTLTEDLRGRAKIGGPYSLANGADKELIDLKLLKGCDDEKDLKCMASIGVDLQADFLMYGSITKKGSNYEITITLLDVKAKKREKTAPQNISISAKPDEILKKSQKVYNGLTGQTDSCTIIVKTPGVDRATILLGSKESGNITNGIGQVNGLSEGRYSVAVEARDYHRWSKESVQCSGGETTNITADLTRLDNKIIPAPDKVTPPGGDDNHEITGTISHPHKSNTWKYVAIGGGMVAAAAAITTIVYRQRLQKLGGDIWSPGEYCAGPAGGPYTASPTAPTGFDTKDCHKGASWSNWTIGAGAVTAISGAFTIFAVVKAVKDSDEPDTGEHAMGRRKHHEPFAITPVVSPTGAGATFRMEW
ncbi:MAG: hypothetical protein ABI678_07265 [Kofleriaceae bacterium]